MRRTLAGGLLVVSLVVAACSSASATRVPGSAGGAPGGTAAPAGTAAGRTAAGGGAGPGAIDPSGLAKLPSEKVCTLLTAAEAGTILGAAVDGTPSGMLVEGLGTNCLYSTVADATGLTSLIKIEFNTLGYKASVSLMKLSGTPQSLTVAARPATGLEAPKDPNSFIKAQLYVSLVDDPASIALYVEAPTLDKAKQVAETVAPRIAGLK